MARGNDGLFGRLLDQLPIGVFVVDDVGHPFYVNDAARKLLGRGIMAEAGPGNMAEVYQVFIAGTEEEYPSSELPVVRALRGDTVHVDDIDIWRPDAVVPIEAWATPIYDHSGRLQHAVAAFQDVTDRREAEARVRSSEERFRAVFDEAPTGMALVSVGGQFLQVNAALCQITGYTEDELLGRTVVEITHPDDQEEDRVGFAGLVAGEFPTYRVEQRYLRPDGSVVWGLTSRSLVPDLEAGSVVITQVEDITARSHTEETLLYQALHDPLTDLANRTLLDDHLRLATARSRRHDSRHALLFIDLDGFKAVNDSEGHRGGDLVLMAVARRLRGVVRDGDTVARVGGDEFVALLEDVQGLDEAVLVANRVVAAVAQDVHLDHGHVTTVTASLGVAMTGVDHAPHESLLLLADRAMYAAKALGGNAVAVAGA